MCIHDCGNNEWLSGKRTTRETSRDPPGGRAPHSRSAEGGAEVSAGEPPTMAASARAMSQPLAASARRRVLAECAAWWAVRGLQWMANMLPERLLGTAARALGDFVYVVVRWRRRLAEERVALALPHLSHAEHRLVVRDSYTHLALALLWFLRLPRIQQYGHGTIQRLVEISEETKGYLQQILEETGRSQSAIITSGHIGFWELLPTLLASSILPTHTQSIVYRPLHNDPINRLVKELRSGERRELIEDKNCFSLLHHKLKNSSEPSLVGLVADQRQMNPRGQCIVQFLGQSTALSTGAARLRVSTGVSLWFAAVIGNSQKKRANSSGKPFKLILRPISTNATQDQRDGVQQLMQTYATALEDVVQMCATQYLWIHDLWKHREERVIVS